MLLVAVGVMMAISGVFVYASEPISTSILPTDSLSILISCSVAMAVSGLIAFIVIPLRKRRTDGVQGVRIRWIVVDAIIMATLATAFLIAGLILSLQTPSSINARLSDFWETASPVVLTVIQERGQCCGFAGLNDRVLEPCKRYAEAVGCSSVLLDDYKYYAKSILQPALFALGSLCILASILALVFSFVRLRLRNQEAKEHEAILFQASLAAGDDGILPTKLKRSQPFDAWHKAVFL